MERIPRWFRAVSYTHLSAEEPVATPSEAPNEVAATPAAAPADERASREPAPRNRKTAAIPMTAWTRTASCVVGLIYASIDVYKRQMLSGSGE